MKEIVIEANNSNIIYHAEDTDTLRDVLTSDELIRFFGLEEDEDSLHTMVSNVISLNGADISESVMIALLDVCPNDKMVFTFDLEACSDEVSDEEPHEDAQISGVAFVYPGLYAKVAVSILDGKTTVEQAINDPAVIKRSGMTSSNFEQCTITLNDATVSWESARVLPLHDGDNITLSAPVASTKGGC